MTKPVVLFRKSLGDDGEFSTCKSYIDTVCNRNECPKESLVIGRYSCLPYYREYEYDLKARNCTLINTCKQHEYVANFIWYYNVVKYTPKTWFDDDYYKSEYDGPVVVKGKTNSKKMQWNKSMFAQNKKQAVNIAADLVCDSMIGEQQIIYRKYEELESNEKGLYDLPFANEWRFFCLGSTIITSGYYWTLAQNIPLRPDKECCEFANKMAEIISKEISFFTIDVAKTKEGKWILIEVNDGQMSGLQCCLATRLYSKLFFLLNQN